MGMRLFASAYWKCTETACISEEKTNIKFVFSESLIEDDLSEFSLVNCIILQLFLCILGSKDQITNFITHHNHQAGIQHIGFMCTSDIKDAVRTTKANGAQFLQPCREYYLKVSRKDENIGIFLFSDITKENNGRVIEEANENVDELAKLGILLDNEAETAEISQCKKR